MCGVIGIIGHPHAAELVHAGLYTLQHRGQDAAGILTYDQHLKKFFLVKDTGLVSQVFTKDNVSSLKGDLAIGHNRYSTVGSGEKTDLQPLIVNYPLGIGMAHNGNTMNYFDLADKLKKEHYRHPLTTNDLEVILNIFADSLMQNMQQADIDVPESVNESFLQVMQRSVKSVYDQVKGGYSVVGTIAGLGLFAFRDPQGIRPLQIGIQEENEDNKKSYVVTSETTTIHFLKHQFLRDVKPGEFIFITHSGELYSFQVYEKKKAHCMFEWIYFASAESDLDETSVYSSRLKFGEQLAEKIQHLQQENDFPIDMVAPVPETSRLATITVSEKLQVPYREILIKNRYIHRSFILDSDLKRKNAVGLKLSPVMSEIKGKNILLIDDSIVRGTTAKRIIELIRKAGAKKIYLASTCPPIKHPCFYGIDFPDPKELLAHNRTYDEMADIIGVDKLIFLDTHHLKEALGDRLCMACLDGNYPVTVEQNNFTKHRLQEREKNRTK